MKIDHNDGGVSGRPEPDVFQGWLGDAESIRSVIAAVAAVDQERRLSLGFAG